MIYLSIDLDYWCKCHERRCVDSFFKHVFELKLPIYCAPFHHQLLEHINQREYDEVINVDYHSDICDNSDKVPTPLNEGTWANFVKYREQFDWRYPSEECLSEFTGYCHDDISPFDTPEVAGWPHASKKKGLRGIRWKGVTGVGVSLSKYWLYGNYNCLWNVLEYLKIDTWIMTPQRDIVPKLCTL